MKILILINLIGSVADQVSNSTAVFDSIMLFTNCEQLLFGGGQQTECHKKLPLLSHEV